VIKLLVSIKHPFELISAVRGGADIVDVKNPSRGSLGLPDYSVVREVLREVRKLGVSSIEVSSAGGDIRGIEPHLEYIAYTMGSLGINYFKIGLAARNISDAKIVALRVSEILESLNSNTKLVLVGYADYTRAGSIEPLKVVEIAGGVGASVVMIDTYVKDGEATFNFLHRDYLKDFVNKARENGLLTAIAGGLKKQHIRDIIELGFDIVGFRGAVCSGGRDSVVSEERVCELKKAIREYYEDSMRT